MAKENRDFGDGHCLNHSRWWMAWLGMVQNHHFFVGIDHSIWGGFVYCSNHVFRCQLNTSLSSLSLIILFIL